MTLYADSSALLKAYVDEPDSDVAVAHLQSDEVLVSSWVTVVEVRRNLSRLLTGPARRAALSSFESDIDAFALVVAGEEVCRAAGRIGEVLGVRSLDAIHLASAQALQIPTLSFLTFDLRQAQAARSLGFAVLGA
ncbi:MAG: type II toxin-antitoxin system VapC family toxin [Actinomycetes bacterium]|jgi:predicted nucleic acid-binding protein